MKRQYLILAVGLPYLAVSCCLVIFGNANIPILGLAHCRAHLNTNAALTAVKRFAEHRYIFIANILHAFSGG
jgi:hypothetical protein